MGTFQYLVKILVTTGLGLSLFSCGSGGTVDEVIIPAEALSVITETPIETPKEDIQVLFSEDIEKDIRQSVPTDINIPLGLKAALDIEYLGAFRALADGQSTSDYAVGTLGFNPDNNSIFMAGHDYHGAIAEFAIPSQLSFESQASNIPEAAVLQQYVKILNKKETGNTTNKINGILYHNQNLLVSSEIWYDGNASNTDNLQVFSNAMDIRSSGYKGMLRIEGAAKASGYMSKVPTELQEKIGTEYLVGWASNYAITSRYSQGPSFYKFDPNQAIDAVVSVDRKITTDPLMVFPLSAGKQLVEGGNEYAGEISPIWGPLSRARYGFIIPGTTYFLAIGQHSGLHSGVGYKITQDNGRLCGGPCSYENSDIYNYFWVFDVNDMLSAEHPWLVRPVSYGKWSHPYDKDGANGVIGGAYDDEKNILYLALRGAGKIGAYDLPPLIIGYQVKAKK
ncbi:MAG: hypothetical protein ACJAS1_006971 [Oleiphilaceae bacterium]|jgi:hypothetical protein